MKRRRFSWALEGSTGTRAPTGRNSLVRFDRCEEGGARLFAGVDDDGDGVLAAAEVDSTAELDCREPAPGVAAVKRCRADRDCAALKAYCAQDRQCHPIAPGGTCKQALEAPIRDLLGPTISGAGQDVIGTGGSRCTKNPAHCPNDGNVCQFSFQWTDPEGDVAATPAAVYQKVLVYRRDGLALPPHDVTVVEGSTIRFSLCLDSATKDIALAAQLLDSAGHPSNPLCFTGSAP